MYSHWQTDHKQLFSFILKDYQHGDSPLLQSVLQPESLSGRNVLHNAGRALHERIEGPGPLSRFVQFDQIMLMLGLEVDLNGTYLKQMQGQPCAKLGLRLINTF